MSSEVDQWSQVKHLNRDPLKGGFTRQMARAENNDRGRGIMGAFRRLIENAEWFNALNANEDDFTVLSKGGVSGTATLIITDADGRDATSHFTVGSWIKIALPTVWYARVSAISAYADGAITVTLDPLLDSFFADSLLSSGAAVVSNYHSKAVQEAAFHPVGNTLAQVPKEIPSIDDLGDWITKDMGHDESGQQIDLDLLDGVHGDTGGGYELGTSVSQNVAMNGAFQVWQAGPTFNSLADTLLCSDRWKAQVQTSGNWDFVQETSDVPSGFKYALRMNCNTNTPGSNKVGIFQWIFNYGDGAPCYRTPMTLSYYTKSTGSSIGACRAAVIEASFEVNAHTTTNPVSAWNAVGTNPTLNAPWSYVNVDPGTDAHTLTGSWTRVTVEIPSSTWSRRSLGIFIWIDDDDVTVGDDWFITGVQLEPNATATAYKHRKFHEELMDCKGYYDSTYSYGVPGGTVTTEGQLSSPLLPSLQIAAGKRVFEWRYAIRQIPMGATVISLYSPNTGTLDRAYSSASGDRIVTDLGRVDNEASMEVWLNGPIPAVGHFDLQIVRELR